MRLGRITITAAAIAVVLVCSGTAQAFEFRPSWGYAFVDDRPFHEPGGALLSATQAFPRGRIRDTVRDNVDVRMIVHVFGPDAHSVGSYSVDEGDFTYVPIDRRFDTNPRQIAYVRYQFCRLNINTKQPYECLPFHRIGRPPPPAPPPPPPPVPPPDRDGDGFDETRDCDDRNAIVRPGGTEVPGNGIDEDCDGADAAGRITAAVSNFWFVRGRVTRIQRLSVRDAPPGATIRVTCRERKCKFRRHTVRAGRNGRAKLTPLFKRRRLRVGAVLEVRITAPNAIGKVVRYPIRRGKVPRARTLCLPPGARRPTPC